MANPLYDTLFAPHLDSDKAFLDFSDSEPLTYAGFLTEAARFAAARTSPAAGGDPAGRRDARQDPLAPPANAGRAN